MSSATRIAIIAALMCSPGGEAVAQEGGPLKLQLFNTGELVSDGLIEQAETCAFALHQDDKDPARETYHFAFFRPLATEIDGGTAVIAPDAAVGRPGIIQIDGAFLEVTAAAASLPAAGGPPAPVHVAPRQLWVGEDGRLLVALNLEVVRDNPDEVVVPSGMMTVVRGGALPFWVKVAGGTVCTDAPPPAAGATGR